MPISKENRARYPKDWPSIRAEVLERAGHKCEECGVPNKTFGCRDLTGKFWTMEQFENGDVEKACVDFEGPHAKEIKKGFMIVLTIAHLDHNPENNGEPGNRPNLKAWCQKCHLAYDLPMHLENSRKTREAKKGQVSFL